MGATAQTTAKLENYMSSRQHHSATYSCKTYGWTRKDKVIFDKEGKPLNHQFESKRAAKWWMRNGKSI